LGRRKPYEENGDEGRAKGCPGLMPASQKSTVPSYKPDRGIANLAASTKSPETVEILSIYVSYERRSRAVEEASPD
jgi:hypothetical protein